jgi:hypothetical protein
MRMRPRAGRVGADAVARGGSGAGGGPVGAVRISVSWTGRPSAAIAPPGDRLGSLGFGRHTDDHHSDVWVEQSDAAEDFQAADAWEVERDDDPVRTRALDVKQGFETVLGLEHFVAVLAQGCDDLTPRRGVGVGDQDRCDGLAGWAGHGAMEETPTRSSPVGACVPTRSVPCRTSLLWAMAIPAAARLWPEGRALA